MGSVKYFRNPPRLLERDRQRPPARGKTSLMKPEPQKTEKGSQKHQKCPLIPEQRKTDSHSPSKSIQPVVRYPRDGMTERNLRA